MLKSESKSDRVLRSASPHRNAYKSDFHSIKCSFEGPSVLYSYGGSEARGRPSGSRVNEIKNIFLQMDAQQPQDSTNQTKPGTTKLQLSSSSYRSSMGSASSVESGTSDVVRKSENISFDKVALAEKFSETRKLFESGLPTDKGAPGRSVSRSSVRSVSEEGRCVKKLTEKTDQIQGKDRGRTERETPPHKHAVMMKNAGPISRRLESFMLDSDNESLSGPSVSTRSQSPSGHSQPPSSPNSEHSGPPLSPESDSSPTSYSLWPDSPFGQADANLTSKNESQYSPTPVNGVCAEESPHWSSHCTNTTVDNANETSVSVVSTEPTILFKSEKRHRLSLSSGSGSPSADGNECLESDVSKEKQHKVVFGSPSLSTVRAELVVVHNESSEGESNEEERIVDDVFEEVKNEQPPTDLPSEKEVQIIYHEDKSGRDFRIGEEKKKEGMDRAMFIENKDQERQGKLAEGKGMHKEEQKEEEEDKEVKAGQDQGEQVQEEPCPHSEMKAKQDLKEEEESGMQDEQRETEENVEDDSDVVKEGLDEEDDEHDVEVSVEERQQQVNEDSAGKRPLICGIENAAFVDDRENKLHYQQKGQHTGPDSDHFQEYEELSGLSDEEDLSPRRKIRFSTAPIKVWLT